uniref:CobW family GTP-binding protein n=1 Tax=uncultured Draconibacterium sp. TaxID=1573823 RepID=UPI0032167855
MQKIPFHIISGFLGSGKTTFLKRIIEQYSSEKKIGIIQNEFAPSNIDGVELKKTGEDFNLLEINNGSVFCVCLLGDFVYSLDKFIDMYQPDILIIEASGLSDTTAVSEVITAGSLAEKMYLASNWCIVDAQNFAKVGLMKQRVVHQVRMADIIVINKTDLVKTDLVPIEQEIKRINPFAEIKQSSFCAIDFKLGSSTLNKFYFDDVKVMSRPDINSMVIKSSRQVSRNSLQLFLQKWAPQAYRIKGFVKLDEGKTVAIQCTFDTVEIIDVENDFYPTEIVALTDRFTLREWNRAFKDLQTN